MQQQPMMAPGGAPMGAPAGMPMGGGASVAHEITHGPSFALLRVDLQPGQTLVAEAGSMVARSCCTSSFRVDSSDARLACSAKRDAISARR